MLQNWFEPNKDFFPTDASAGRSSIQLVGLAKRSTLFPQPKHAYIHKYIHTHICTCAHRHINMYVNKRIHIYYIYSYV